MTKCFPIKSIMKYPEINDMVLWLSKPLVSLPFLLHHLHWCYFMSCHEKQRQLWSPYHISHQTKGWDSSLYPYKLAENRRHKEESMLLEIYRVKNRQNSGGTSPWKYPFTIPEAKRGDCWTHQGIRLNSSQGSPQSSLSKSMTYKFPVGSINIFPRW